MEGSLVLGKRLEAIASLIKGKYLIDVGSDHGKLPIFLLCNNLLSNAIATDVNELPLKKAENAAKSFSVTDMEFILADGLKLPKAKILQSSDIVIAGMGGELIADILKYSETDLLLGKNLILQPMTRPEKLREFLAINGFTTVKETVVFENNKYFIIIQCEYTKEKTVCFPEKIYLGKLDNNDKTVRNYIEDRIKQLSFVVKEIKKSESADVPKEISDQLEAYNSFLKR